MTKNLIVTDVIMYVNQMTFAQDCAEQKTDGTCMREK